MANSEIETEWEEQDYCNKHVGRTMTMYGGGVLDCTKTELCQMDIKTRKILTMNGIFHKQGNVARLHIKINGGRVLRIV